MNEKHRGRQFYDNMRIHPQLSFALGIERSHSFNLPCKAIRENRIQVSLRATGTFGKVIFINLIDRTAGRQMKHQAQLDKPSNQLVTYMYMFYRFNTFPKRNVTHPIYFVLKKVLLVASRIQYLRFYRFEIGSFSEEHSYHSKIH